MNKLILITLGIAITLGFTGCEKATVVSEATADVFIQSIKSPKDTSIIVYSAIHSVFSYNLISSASVVTPDGETLHLTDYDKLGNSFYNAPADTTFSRIPPTLGTYNYTVTFKDKEVLTYANSLSSTYLIPPAITALTRSTKSDSIYISWKAVTNADGYQIKISKLDTITKAVTQIKYITPFSDASVPLKTRLTFLIPRSYFTLSLNNSETYSIQLDALLFENTTSNLLQAIGTSTKHIRL